MNSLNDKILPYVIASVMVISMHDQYHNIYTEVLLWATLVPTIILESKYLIKKFGIL